MQAVASWTGSEMSSQKIVEIKQNFISSTKLLRMQHGNVSLHEADSLVPNWRRPNNGSLWSFSDAPAIKGTSGHFPPHRHSLFETISHLLRGVSLLNQTGPVNCHAMLLCLAYYDYKHTGVTDQSQAMDSDHKATCSFSNQQVGHLHQSIKLDIYCGVWAVSLDSRYKAKVTCQCSMEHLE
ncbi:hypothetical protein TNCV_2133751 [Trichonephila clavipes]|nr:hypothetical protein TNCV_2133751 [Trichonephila clavipes]